MASMILAPLLLLLLPPLAVLLVAARGVSAMARAHFAWPAGSSFVQMRRKHARKAEPEQRGNELRVSLYRKEKDVSSKDEEEAVECVFCLSGVEEGNEIRELKCRHLFHRSCLDRWLARPPATCPLCRCRLLTSSPWVEDDGGGEEEEEDSDMVLFLAFVHRGSIWFWSS